MKACNQASALTVVAVLAESQLNLWHWLLLLQEVALKMTRAAGFKELRVLDWESARNAYYLAIPY
jgi:hypothetical protein